MGNGFDLASGLKTRYYDFFAERFSDKLLEEMIHAHTFFFKHFDNIQYFDSLLDLSEKYFDVRIKILSDDYKVSDIYDLLKESKLTFWDIMLFYSQDIKEKDLKNVQWQDIESRMLEFLAKDLKNKPSFKKINDHFLYDSPEMNIISWLCLHLAYYLPKRKKKYSKYDFVEYLYDELCLFEKYFAEYINSIIDDQYKKRAAELLCSITGTTLANCKDKIISFNYTMPFDLTNIDVINIHGNTHDQNILFGIDQDGIEPVSDVYRFTKTFRQMTETKLSTIYGRKILPEKNTIEEISFFGHSLSNLDYSYFQTLFDCYHLYDSEIRLVFYYKVYKGITNKEMELDLAQKISRILKKYSPSIGNTQKGNNLMHKLLLEKRLLIEEIH